MTNYACTLVTLISEHTLRLTVDLCRLTVDLSRLTVDLCRLTALEVDSANIENGLQGPLSSP